MATFELNDDSVVVIVGSGAGGGTLGNELAQKGIKVVMLEAGKQESIDSFQNNEWGSFLQISWLDKRTTSGTWRVARDFPGLPAWICKTVGGTTTHWAGASLRLQEHEFKARTTYGDIPGANLLDWPITLAELEPYYAKAEDKMGVTRTNGIPGLPGNNNFKVLYTGAKRLGYQHVNTGHMAINSQPRADRPSCQQIGFCFQGCKSGAKWSTLYTEIPAALETGKLELRPECTALQIQHDDAGKVTGVLYADKDGKQQVQKARAGLRRRQHHREPAAAAELGLGQVPGRARQQLGPGRQELHAAHDRLGLRRLRQAGAHVPWHHHGRRDPGRGPQRPEARLRRRLRDGDPLARHAVHGGLPRSGRLGPRVHPQDGDLPQHGRHVAGRRGHAAGDQPGHPAREREGQLRPADPQRPLRRPPERRRHAQPRLPAGDAPSTRRPAPPRSTRPRPTPAPTISAPTG